MGSLFIATLIYLGLRGAKNIIGTYGLKGGLFVGGLCIVVNLTALCVTTDVGIGLLFLLGFLFPIFCLVKVFYFNKKDREREEMLKQKRIEMNRPIINLEFQAYGIERMLHSFSSITRTDWFTYYFQKLSSIKAYELSLVLLYFNCGYTIDGLYVLSRDKKIDRMIENGGGIMQVHYSNGKPVAAVMNLLIKRWNNCEEILDPLLIKWLVEYVGEFYKKLNKVELAITHTISGYAYKEFADEVLNHYGYVIEEEDNKYVL